MRYHICAHNTKADVLVLLGFGNTCICHIQWKCSPLLSYWTWIYSYDVWAGIVLIYKVRVIFVKECRKFLEMMSEKESMKFVKFRTLRAGFPSARVWQISSLKNKFAKFMIQNARVLMIWDCQSLYSLWCLGDLYHVRVSCLFCHANDIISMPVSGLATVGNWYLITSQNSSQSDLSC